MGRDDMIHPQWTNGQVPDTPVANTKRDGTGALGLPADRKRRGRRGAAKHPVSAPAPRLHTAPGAAGRDGPVLVNIRKSPGVAFRTLDELVDRGTIDRSVAAFPRACVRARLSILFAGPPGSGKTTL